MRAVSPPGFSRGFYAIRLYEKERKRYIYAWNECRCRYSPRGIFVSRIRVFHDKARYTYRRYFFVGEEHNEESFTSLRMDWISSSFNGWWNIGYFYDYWYGLCEKGWKEGYLVSLVFEFYFLGEIYMLFNEAWMRLFLVKESLNLF